MIKFIKQLQKSDDNTKKRWLVLLTASAALLIAATWVVYLNATITTVAAPVGQEQLAVGADEPGLFFALSRKTITGLTNSFAYFQNKITTQNQFIVSRDNQNFIWDELEALPQRQLP